MEREDPYASILEFCTPTCSNGVHLDLGRNKNNYLFHRTPEGVSGDEQLLPFCPIPEESLGDYFCYTPPPPETPNNPPTGNEDFSTNNTPFCVVSYQDSPPSLQGSSIPDDFPFLRLEQFDSGFEGGTMVSLDGDCTNPEMMMMMMMGDASNLLLSRLKSLAVRVSSLDFNEEVLYGDVFSFFTDFRISVFSVHQHDTRHSSKKRKDPGFGLGLGLGLGLGSVPPPPPPLKKPYYLHLGSSNVNQLVDSDCGFEVVPFDFEGPLCHSPKSKGKHGAHSSESIHSGGLIHLSDEEDEEEEEEGIGVHIVREEGMSLRESEPGSSKGDGGRTTTSLLALLKCSETLCGKV